MVQAFQVADDVLRQGVQGIAELVTLPALINLDFADVRTTMRDAGPGDPRDRRWARRQPRRLRRAARDLVAAAGDVDRRCALPILLSITGGRDLSLMEVTEAAMVIQEAAHPDANIIFGANVDEELDDEVWVTVIATRFDGRGRRADGAQGARASGRARRAPRRERRGGEPRARGHLDVRHFHDNSSRRAVPLGP